MFFARAGDWLSDCPHARGRMGIHAWVYVGVCVGVRGSAVGCWVGLGWGLNFSLFSPSSMYLYRVLSPSLCLSLYQSVVCGGERE